MALIFAFFFLINWNSIEKVPITPSLMNQISEDIKKGKIDGNLQSYIVKDIYNHFIKMDYKWQNDHINILEYIYEKKPYIVYVRTYLASLYLYKREFEKVNNVIEKPFTVKDTLWFSDKMPWKEWIKSHPPKTNTLRSFLVMLQMYNMWDRYIFVFENMKNKEKKDLRYYYDLLSKHKLYLFINYKGGNNDIDKFIRNDVNMRINGSDTLPNLIKYLKGEIKHYRPLNSSEKYVCDYMRNKDNFLKYIMQMKLPPYYTIGVVDSMIEDTVAFLISCANYPYFGSLTNDKYVKGISLYECGKLNESTDIIRSIKKEDYWKNLLINIIKGEDIKKWETNEILKGMWYEN